MNNDNGPRISDRDVFLAKKLRNANFDTGFYQIPEIKNFDISEPERLVLWSKRKKCHDKSTSGLVFYEYDCNFDGKNGIYNILKYGTETEVSKLIEEIKGFAFVVCPDYSVYGNFPNYKQIDAIARSREVGYILSTYGLKVVVNYRATYEWTYELALSGICLNSIVSIGTLGALKDKESRGLLKNSIDALVNNIHPRMILVYGNAPTDVFASVIENNIRIVQFDSEISLAFGGLR